MLDGPVSATAYDCPNGLLCQAEFAPERMLRYASFSITVPNRAHLLLGQLSLPTLAAAREPFGMPTVTTSLPASCAILSISISSIICNSTQKQVIRAAASRVVAVVTDLETRGDISVCQYPRESIGLYRPVTSVFESTITRGKPVCRPLPATIGIITLADFRPEAICGRMGMHAEPPIQCAMPQAAATALGPFCDQYSIRPAVRQQ